MMAKKLCIYITAGYPNIDDLPRLIQSLDQQGVDYVEVGMPYSDPLADGSVIQHTSSVALENGITLSKLFDQLERIKGTISSRLIYMGYFNPLLQYGLEKFIDRALEVGIEGCIIPDLPIDLYIDQYREAFRSGVLGMNFLVSPSTSDERIQLADRYSDQYLYVISQNTITGTPKEVTNQQVQFYERLDTLNLKKERLIGFGIHDKKSFDFACQYADGAIIGSAYLKAIGGGVDILANSQNFIESLN